MPKYVLKEHVEKGLVDPTKSLDEQLEYKEQLQKEAEEKKKSRPQQSEQNKPNHYQKKEKNQHNYKPKHRYNKVTIDTKIPERPKKILEVPNQQKFKETLQNLKEQKRRFIDLKKKLIDEQNALIRETMNSKKSGSIAVNLFSGAMKEKFNIENILRKEISTLAKKRAQIYKQIEGYKQKMNSLKRPQNSQLDSLQNLKQKIQEKEHRIITAKLDKKQETKLINQIQTLKRALHKAKPRIEIDTEINKSRDHLDILYTQVKNLKQEIDLKRKQADQIKAEVDQLKTYYRIKKPEQIREEYDQKIKEANSKIQQINTKIDDLHKVFYKQEDQFYEQQDLLKQIDYIQKEVAYLKKQKQEAEKRKQQKEQNERKKKKQFEEREKRREEKKKQEEERKQKQQERVARLQKQRQKHINRNPHHAEIQLAHFLVQYCESLKPSNSVNRNEENNKKQTIEFNKEWQKQIKKGALLIVSKKSMVEQQNKKKVQKPKKKEEKLADQTFTHNFETVNRFQLLNILVPKNLAEVDQTIKLLQDKIEFYNNPSAEEIERFKLKAARQFDLEHGISKQKGYKEKQEIVHQHNQQKDHKHKKEKKKFTQNDFPQI